MKSILFVLNGSRFFGINVFVLSDWYVYFVCGRLLTPGSIYQDIICDTTLCAVWVIHQNKIGTIRTTHPIRNFYTHMQKWNLSRSICSQQMFEHIVKKRLWVNANNFFLRQSQNYHLTIFYLYLSQHKLSKMYFEDTSLFHYYAKCDYSSLILSLTQRVPLDHCNMLSSNIMYIEYIQFLTGMTNWSIII